MTDLERELERCEMFLRTGGTQAEMDHARAHIHDLREAVHRERNIATWTTIDERHGK